MLKRLLRQDLPKPAEEIPCPGAEGEARWRASAAAPASARPAGWWLWLAAMPGASGAECGAPANERAGRGR